MPTAVRERPILFSPPMVRAILEGVKTQTRRVVKPQPKIVNDLVSPHEAYKGIGEVDWFGRNAPNSYKEISCPYGQPGDRLWVKEGFKCDRDKGECFYVADGKGMGTETYLSLRDKHPNACRAIFMRREWSRINQPVTEVRVQRVQDISEEDAIAEGAMEWWNELSFAEQAEMYNGGCGPVAAFHMLWDSINGKKNPVASNPWVWAVSFQRVEATDAN